MTPAVSDPPRGRGNQVAASPLASWGPNVGGVATQPLPSQKSYTTLVVSGFAFLRYTRTDTLQKDFFLVFFSSVNRILA